MMNNSKILTVSYGTFSCTLEGFDDSFGTMKAIAEYFRDLAAEDRYFGAEPSQPDAEMLAHIAQKEISRRVDARRQDGKIVLSASDADGPAQAPVQTPRSDAALATTALTSLAAAQTPVAEAEPTLAATDETAQAGAKAAQDAIVSAAQADIAEPEIDLSEIDIVPGQPDEEIKAFFDENATAVDENDDLPALEKGAPVNSSIAAKLQRIRSVVSRQEVETNKADYIEDEHADEPEVGQADAAGNKEFVADAVKDIETALNADDAAEAAPQDEEDDVTAWLAGLETETDGDDQPEESIAAEDDGALEEESTGENLFEDEPAVQELTVDETAAPEPASAPRGRVIKVKRADLDKAIANGSLEEYSGSDHVVPDVEADISDTVADAVAEVSEPAQANTPDEEFGPSSLSAAEEDELARELADVEAGLSEMAADAEPRRTLPSLEGDQGSDMNRLLAETDNQMDDPESAVRRDAIAHLRAAVAAKKADVALGAPEKTEEEDGAYRNDLAEVVKPRRHVITAATSDRPAAARPAPLKLVAEQRINTEQTGPAVPVTPRRVATTAPVATSSDTVDAGFAEFASEMGATTLPELLEAAASYMSFVEGHDEFSRPQLMTTVRQIGQEEFSREDGLRSFGMLLRTGKLKKLEGGRFAVSDKIGYQPDERAVG